MPRLARIDRLFRRFLRNGDARALGQVFDATAPELLKIAAYLAEDRQKAEDLVQSAFLIALERRAEFEANRKVMPWLCGIVANLARAERRRARRPVGEAALGSDIDPVSSAEGAEFREAFARARDGLGEPYRPVLELHLEHGLNAKEIASVLDRPAGTVRAQITRGLELLRKRLPSGFVAGAFAITIAPASLRAMRAVVLSHANPAAAATSSALAGATAAALTGGGTVNKKLLVAGATGALLLALGSWLAGIVPVGAGSEPAVRPDAELVTAPAVEADLGEAADSESDRQSVPAEPALESAPAAGRVEVSARWKSDGAPAADLAIEVVYVAGELPELAPLRALTDRDGRCALEEVPVGAVSVFASTGQREVVTVEAGQTAELALELEAWGVVRGLVVDPNDRPIAGADVWVSSEVKYRPREVNSAGHGQYGGFTLVTDERGRFETRLAQHQCISAFKAGYGPSPTMYPCSGKAPPEGIDLTMRLVAEGSALIVEVRDASGAPIEDAHVLAGDEVPHFVGDEISPLNASPPALRKNTDANGLAELGRLRSGKLPVQVRALDYVPWKGEEVLPPSGVAHLVVVLEPGASVHGVVTDDSGTPVEGAVVYHGRRSSNLAASNCVSDEAGRFELRSLPMGAVEITAWKREVGQAVGELVLESGARHEWRPQLSMRPAITGVVLDLAGRPAPDAYVVCVSPGMSRAAAYAKSDENGRFLLGPLEQDRLYQVTAEIVDEALGALRITERDVAPETELTMLVVGDDTAPTARLRGRLLEQDGTPATQVHLMVTPGIDELGFALNVEQDGTFESGPHKPGRLRVSVTRHQKTIADFGEFELRPHETLDVGDVYVPAPGGAVVRVLGGDVIEGVANLYRGDHDLFMSSRRIKAEEVEWPELPPGDYRVCVRRGGSTPFAGVGTFTVTSDAVARVDMQVAPAQRCEIRFVVDGECQRWGILTASNESGREVYHEREAIPPDGATEVVILPAGRMTVRFETRDGWVGESAATIPGEGVLELVLTAP